MKEQAEGRRGQQYLGKCRYHLTRGHLPPNNKKTTRASGDSTARIIESCGQFGSSGGRAIQRTQRPSENIRGSGREVEAEQEQQVSRSVHVASGDDERGPAGGSGHLRSLLGI